MIQPAEKAVRLLAVEVRLPRGWDATAVERSGDARVAHTTAAEYGRRSRREDRRVGRYLLVREELLRTPMTVVDYLSTQAGENLAELPVEQLPDPDGHTWSMVVVPERGDESRGSAWAIYAGTILPPNRAVSIQMAGRGALVPEDRDDVRRLTAHVRYVGGTPPAPGARTRPATQPGE